MALHRDIYWIGRQWAVTGSGVQAIDQRLKGAFDIEMSRLWDEDLSDRMRTHAWLNAADFDKALSVARARFPEPPRKSRPLVESILNLIQPSSSRSDSSATPNEAIGSEPHEPPAAMPALRAQGRLARFLPQWRVRR